MLGYTKELFYNQKTDLLTKHLNSLLVEFTEGK